jgi:hypothetical protein
MPCFLLHRPLGISRGRRLLCRPRQAAPCQAPRESPKDFKDKGNAEAGENKGRAFLATNKFGGFRTDSAEGHGLPDDAPELG